MTPQRASVVLEDRFERTRLWISPAGLMCPAAGPCHKYTVQKLMLLIGLVSVHLIRTQAQPPRILRGQVLAAGRNLQPLGSASRRLEECQVPIVK
jgi:hypothetical protein